MTRFGFRFNLTTAEGKELLLSLKSLEKMKDLFVEQSQVLKKP